MHDACLPPPLNFSPATCSTSETSSYFAFLIAFDNLQTQSSPNILPCHSLFHAKSTADIKASPSSLTFNNSSKSSLRPLVNIAIYHRHVIFSPPYFRFSHASNTPQYTVYPFIYTKFCTSFSPKSSFTLFPVPYNLFAIFLISYV